MPTPSVIEHSKTCPICLEEYSHTGPGKPKLAPCGHTLCLRCLISMAVEQGHQGKCPVCRYPYRLYIGQKTRDSIDQITCHICTTCFEPFELEGDRRPKLLPCGHTLCLHCLKNLKAEGDKITWVECEKEHVVPEGGVSCFPTNTYFCALLGLQYSNQSSTPTQLLSPTSLSLLENIHISLQNIPEVQDTEASHDPENENIQVIINTVNNIQSETETRNQDQTQNCSCSKKACCAILLIVPLLLLFLAIFLLYLAFVITVLTVGLLVQVPYFCVYSCAKRKCSREGIFLGSLVVQLMAPVLFLGWEQCKPHCILVNCVLITILLFCWGTVQKKLTPSEP